MKTGNKGVPSGSCGTGDAAGADFQDDKQDAEPRGCRAGRLERRYDARFSERLETITADNGSAFWTGRDWNAPAEPHPKRARIGITRTLAARGNKENRNKLIRHFVPKGTDIGKLTHSEVKQITHIGRTTIPADHSDTDRLP